MGFLGFILSVLLVLINSQNNLACAQNCWRNTPCRSIQQASFPGEWEANIFAPSSRAVSPSALLDYHSGEHVSSWNGKTALGRDRIGLVLDFGREVGGIATIDYNVFSVEGNGAIGIAFTEAKNWIGPDSDYSSGNGAFSDGALYANFSKVGNFNYIMPDEYLRGGFRYMTLFLVAEAASISINNVTLEIAFQPTWANLQAYQGYFHSSDALLNKIWYSGAYTLQTASIPPSTGRAWPAPASGWSEVGELGPGYTILTDGAKRDRTVWPGDLGVAVPAAAYSTGDLESVKNGLQAMYDDQNSSTGQFPFSGPPLMATGSDTYHMWTLIGTYNYVLYSDDTDFLRANWESYIAAMSFILDQVTDSGLLFVKSDTADWGRFDANGTLTSAQSLLYRSLVTGATLASWLGDTDGQGETWLQKASEIQDLTNAKLWDASAGAFYDAVERPDIHSQDGNSLAVLFGIVNASSTKATDISSYLTQNWTPIGAQCPELSGEISPFISSFEIQMHLLAGETQRALDLIRTSWGWYLNNPNGTQSTMIEGYLTDGTFGYRYNAGYGTYSMTSHSHGWSTGPVTALTEHILGLSITGRAGKTWRLAPQPGDLTSAEGGFTTKLGEFSARWSLDANGSFKLDYQTPEGTTGDVVLPMATDKAARNVLVDGASPTKRSSWAILGSREARKVVRIRGDGGKHSIFIK
ncbi:Six-hairpin glycosidase-like protein [Pseudomassariella vexata]|uniref:Six-hairpin glycosidase-like protein n=1 Tax=Pseudomassariella vexata TaxID=1141098 RepID=A0A1Y2DQ76_9PEZI|nr:Six-hairpin glycosidase-like protein [Pseudomassariella vexata]ORY61294.1 Six-hairpin glycosidase-like protein [Pseudomassariella vexata]